MAQIFLSYYFCCVGGAVDDTSTSIHADFKQKFMLKIIVVITQTFSVLYFPAFSLVRIAQLH